MKQSLIKWNNSSAEDATRKDDEYMLGMYPEFNLEDKAILIEGGIDRNVVEDMGQSASVRENGPEIWMVYNRHSVTGK